MLYLWKLFLLHSWQCTTKKFYSCYKKDIASFYPLRIHWWIFPDDEESQQKVSYDFILTLCSVLFQKEVLFAQMSLVAFISIILELVFQLKSYFHKEFLHQSNHIYYFPELLASHILKNNLINLSKFSRILELKLLENRSYI